MTWRVEQLWFRAEGEPVRAGLHIDSTGIRIHLDGDVSRVRPVSFDGVCDAATALKVTRSRVVGSWRIVGVVAVQASTTPLRFARSFRTIRDGQVREDVLELQLGATSPFATLQLNDAPLAHVDLPDQFESLLRATRRARTVSAGLIPALIDEDLAFGPAPTWRRDPEVMVAERWSDASGRRITLELLPLRRNETGSDQGRYTAELRAVGVGGWISSISGFAETDVLLEHGRQLAWLERWLVRPIRRRVLHYTEPGLAEVFGVTPAPNRGTNVVRMTQRRGGARVEAEVTVNGRRFAFEGRTPLSCLAVIGTALEGIHTDPGIW